MKNTLTIILLSISLLGFSQTEKGDFVITPTVGWNTVNYNYIPNGYEDFQFKLPTGFHKYLSDRFSVGFVNYVDYAYNQPYVTSQFYRSTFRIRIIPEVRYNFLKTRLTPFVAGRVFDIGYINTFYDNPTTPVDLRRISSFEFHMLYGVYIDLGVSYFIKDRFGIQVKFVDLTAGTFGVSGKFNLPINFGLQFIINNPRSEIESPK
jgi:hypothetical protein